MKIVFVILLISGCVSQVPQPSTSDEVTVLNVRPIIDYYPLGSYTGTTGEAFYVTADDGGEATKTLSEIVTQGIPAKTTFTSSDGLNLVVFRGTFSTGGHGITIDKVERVGNTFIVHATYIDPGRGTMVTQAFTQPTAIIPIGELPKGSYEAKLRVTNIVRGEDGDEIIAEDKERANVAFEVANAKTPTVPPAVTVSVAPKQLYVKASQSKQFIYWGYNITVDYTSAYPIQRVGVVIDGIEKTFQKELTDSPGGIYWKEGNLSFALKPVVWEMREGQRIPFYEKTWNTTELYFEVVVSGVGPTSMGERQLQVVR